MDLVSVDHGPGNLPDKYAHGGLHGDLFYVCQPAFGAVDDGNRERKETNMSKTLRNIYLSIISFLLCGPLVVVCGVSLNAKKRLFFPPEGVSLRWYQELLTEKSWLIPVQNSLTLATTSSLIALSIALPLAYFLWRYRVFYARALYTLGISPFILPPVITALGFLSFWVTFGVYGKMITTMISHGIFFVTLPLVTISLGFESIDHELVEAAETMGADSKAVFRTIIFPMIRPYMISGYAFAFVLSLNEYIVAYMVTGFTVETLPIKIFNSLRYGYTPVMASVTVVFVLLAAIIFGLIGRFGDLPKLLGAINPEDG
jgi:putative spermidine/putrescine transport system permease protein